MQNSHTTTDKEQAMSPPLKLKTVLQEHGLKIKALANNGPLSYGYVRRILAGDYPVTETFKQQVRDALPFLEIGDDLFKPDDNSAA
jgi:hypothetical protein